MPESLFIYGENGSGRASLFRAVLGIVEQPPGERNPSQLQDNLDAALASGRVAVHFDNGSFAVLGPRWGAPTEPGAPASQTALQVGLP